MKVFLAFALTFSLSAAFAQDVTQQAVSKQQVIQQVCRGSEITSGPKYEMFQRAIAKLTPIVNQDTRHITYVALANNNEINAWARNFDMTHSLICVPEAMVEFMGDAEGELAFIIAHEVGHTIDDVCKTQAGRLAVANSRGSLSERCLEVLLAAVKVQRQQVEFRNNVVAKNGRTRLDFKSLLPPVTVHMRRQVRSAG